MKHIVYILLIGIALSSCGQTVENPEEKDWAGTITYFASADEVQQQTYYKPAVGYVGDPMPFFDPKSQTFKVLYLQDFRPNPAGTYHPIWCVETADAANYTSMGELISCGGINDQDAALGTGSTVYNEADGLYYTFYTGHCNNMSLNPEREAVMLATSADFKTWKKDNAFILRASDNGYSGNDFRDPFVFRGEDGQWHMLVSTRQSGKGVLAEYTSTDLKQWAHAGVFMTMMWDRFYECPDLFKMGDWWYLVYSEQLRPIRRVQYFKGRTLEELKACTANDAGLWPDTHEGSLDSRGLYAGKTASNGTDRYLWGWCPTRAGKDNTAVGADPDEPEWAGNLVAHRLIQHEDGTLTLGEVPAIAAKHNAPAEHRLMVQGGNVVATDRDYQLSGDSYVLFSRLSTCNRISFTLTTSGSTDKFGISLVRGSDSEKYYTMVVNPEGEDRRKVNFEEEGETGIGFIAGIDGYVFDRPADNVYHITLYTDNSVCVLYINDVCCYTNRIYGIRRNGWSINSYGDANITVSDITVKN